MVRPRWQLQGCVQDAVVAAARGAVGADGQRHQAIGAEHVVDAQQPERQPLDLLGPPGEPGPEAHGVLGVGQARR